MKNYLLHKIAFAFISFFFCFFITSVSFSDKITCGSVITIEAEDVLTTNVFTSKPKISAVYVDPIKLKEKTTKLKVINKINKKNHPSSVDVEWKKKIKLCDSKKFSNTKTVFQNLETSPNKIVNCQMDFNGVSNQTLYILPPEISGIYNNSGTTIVSAAQASETIIIEGKYFGTKVPTVYLEYADLSGKIKTIKCKVNKKDLIYKNSKGKPSAMSIYDGASQITVELPAKFPWSSSDTKNHNIVLRNKLGVATVIFNTGAEKDRLEELIVPDGFGYEMIKTLGTQATEQENYSLNSLNNPIQLYLKTQSGVAIPNARVNIYNNTNFIKTVSTDSNGMYEINVEIPDALNEIHVNYDYVGAINGIALDLQTGDITPTEAPMPDVLEEQLLIEKDFSTPNLYYMGGYDNNGVPDYLTEPDDLSADWLAKINFALPNRSVPIYHPEYLESNLEVNTLLLSNADVWITFVHEGAGYRNALGYFTFEAGNPPLTAADIVSNVVIFPNLSYPHLKSGDKVYLGRFQKNTVIGYFLVANGWNGSYVGDGLHTVYSISDFNPESTAENRRHTVLLWNEEKQTQVLGLEDLNRNWNSDDDFNDAVFYLTVNPPEAVKSDSLPDMALPKDTDGDGISDDFDDYIDDPERAYDNYYPSKNKFGTFAFEDKWPEKGDYDMNDLVLQYNFKYVTDGNNNIKDIFPHFKVMAIGAGYYNGFGFELGTTPENVISNIVNMHLSENYISTNLNGTEANQDKATIIVADNVYALFPQPSGFINTKADSPYTEPKEIKFEIHFKEAVSKSSLGSPPYNPFMIADFKNKGRTNEIHLAGFEPTSLAMSLGIVNLFGTKDDDSSIAENKYYLTEENLAVGIRYPSGMGS